MPFAVPLRVDSGGQGVLMGCDCCELNVSRLMIVLLNILRPRTST